MSSGGVAGPLVPTFHGFVYNTMDGLMLFEACLSGKLHHVPRRPHDRERSNLIKSGSIFIYEENASGIKRWTDGVAWSPSRILGNFLLYRELDKPFPPGEKKRAMKRKRTSLPGEPYPRRDSSDHGHENLSTPLTPPSPHAALDGKAELSGSDQDKEVERSLIGSLVDSYGFRPDGLVKKTMSITIDNISHHMVSYYKVDDVKNNLLARPVSDARLHGITIRPELYLKQNFRAPIEESDSYGIDGQLHAHHSMMYSNVPYGMRTYMNGYPGMYAVPTAVVQQPWPGQHNSAPPVSYGHNGGYASSSYASYYKSPTGPSSENKPGEGGQNSSDMTYGNGYSPSYSTGAHSTPPLMQSTYQTPSQASQANATSYHRASYGSNSLTSPTTNGHAPPPPSYSSTASSRSYAVRSPTQSYGIHSTPGSAVPHSPHTLKSPGTTPSAAVPVNDSQVSYRAGSYAVGGTSQTNHTNSASTTSITGANGAGGGGGGGSGEMTGLGITNGGSYGASTNSSSQATTNGAHGVYSYATTPPQPPYRSEP